jgi:hypothetical protein
VLDEVDWRFRALDSIIDRGQQIADRAVDANTASIFSAWLEEANRTVSFFPGMKGFSRAREGDIERWEMLHSLESGTHPHFNLHMWVYFINPLRQIRSMMSVYHKGSVHRYDLFISYSSNDRLFVDKLYDELASYCIKIWWDTTADFSAGDVRRTIDDGLSKSEFGLVVLSPTYLSKKWTLAELDGLFSLDQPAKKRILPILYRLPFGDLVEASPMVSGRVHLDAGKQSVKELGYYVAKAMAQARADSPVLRPGSRRSRSDWRVDDLDSQLRFGRELTERIGSGSILPYFHRWVSGVSSCIEAFEGWADWARWWTCRLEHIRTIRQLEHGDGAQVANVLKRDIKIVEGVRRQLIAGHTAPDEDHIRRPPGSIFISYCHEDAVYAGRLEHECGWMMFSAWWDKDQLAVGDSLAHSISNGMQRCTNGLVLLSKSFLSRKWTQIELDGIESLLTVRGQGNLFVLNLSGQDLSRLFPILASPRLATSFQVPFDPYSKKLREVMLTISMKIAPDN